MKFINHSYLALTEVNLKCWKLLLRYSPSSRKDRQLRDILSLIAKKRPLIATSDQKGYKLAKTKDDIAEVKHQWKELDSRIEQLSARRKPLIDFCNNFNKGVDNIFNL